MNTFTPRNPCPICGGHKDLPQGQGRRCYGYLSEDRQYAHCTREEHAGGLSQHPKSRTFAHRLGGDCKCGTAHGEAPAAKAEPRNAPKWRAIRPVPADVPAPTFNHRDHGHNPTATYAYHDVDGSLLGYRVRFDTADGGKVILPYSWCEDTNEATQKGQRWTWKDHATPRPLYGLEQLSEKPKALVVFVEGEKAADAARQKFPDMVILSCSGGVEGPKYADFEPLKGRDVVCWRDNDEPGTKYQQQIGANLRRIGVTLRAVELPDSLPEKWDLADELPSSVSIEEARRLIVEAPAWDARPEAPTSTYHLTEGGNAERLVAMFGPDLRFNAAHGWLVWDGRRWKVDDGDVPEAAKRVIAQLYAEAEQALDEAWKIGHPNDSDDAKRAHQFAKDLERHAQRSDKASAIAGMCEMARSVPMIRSRAHEFDAHDPTLPDDHPKRFLLNVANGIVDLRTGQLLEHDRSLMITKLSPIAYDPEATCPTWERFVSEIFGHDADLVAWIQRAVGYTLTGSCAEQVFFVCYGQGSNGKTVFTNTLTAVLGDYAGETATETLMTGKREAGSATEDLARLAGLRLVGANETDEGQRFSEARIKALTGNDPITARELYKGSFTYRPQFKLWLRTNHKPIIRGNDEGIWRRPRLIPFLQQFTGDRKDPRLAAKLAAELPGILAWAVRGCLQWQEQGLGEPEAVRAATQDYRDQMDSIGRFLADQGVIEPTRAKTLYEAYVDWCEAMGEHIVNLNIFGRKLTDRGWTARKDGQGNMVRVPPESSVSSGILRTQVPHQQTITDLTEDSDDFSGNSTQAQAGAHAGARTHAPPTFRESASVSSVQHGANGDGDSDRRQYGGFRATAPLMPDVPSQNLTFVEEL